MSIDASSADFPQRAPPRRLTGLDHLIAKATLGIEIGEVGVAAQQYTVVVLPGPPAAGGSWPPTPSYAG